MSNKNQIVIDFFNQLFISNPVSIQLMVNN